MIRSGLSPSVLAGSWHQLGRDLYRDPGLLAQIETSVTFCGMVGLRAKVLGRLGRTENSPSKSVCSILPIAICGPGLYGAPAFILSLAALFLPHF